MQDLCDNNSGNTISLEKFILLGGYNQLIKGCQITVKKLFNGVR